MSISSVGTPSPSENTSGAPAIGTWGTGQTRTAGNLLVALVTAGGSSGAGSPPTSQSGGSNWTKLCEGTQARTAAAIWTLVALGSDAAPTFTSGIAGVHQDMSCTLFELHDSGGSTPLVDTKGTNSNSGSSPLTVTTTGNVTGSGEYAVGVISVGASILSSTNTWAPTGSWTNAFSDSASQNYHYLDSTQSNPGSGATLSYAPGWSASSTDGASGAVAVFKAGTPSVVVTTQFPQPLTAPGLLIPGHPFAGPPHIGDPSIAPPKRATSGGFLIFFP